MAGELGVDRLVGAVGLPLEKVGLPAPAVVQRGRPGRRRRPRSGSPPRSRAAARSQSKSGSSEISTTRLALVAQPSEVGRLVLAPLAKDELGLLVVERRLDDLAASDLKRERRHVLAPEVPRDIGGREEEAVVFELHSPKYRPGGGARLRLEPDQIANARRSPKLLFSM